MMSLFCMLIRTINCDLYYSYNKMNCELMLTYDTPAYMFNVYKNQLSLKTGSRNLTGPKMLPTIWHTYMKLVTKYQFLPSIVAEKNATKTILDGQR